MTLEEFIELHNGKFEDFDKAFGDQCKDLFSLYNLEVVENVNYVWGDAKDLWDNAPDEFYERLTLNPRRGDVVIWGTGVGEYGHVAIYLNGDENNFTSFDQNWPHGNNTDPCQKINHNYKNIIGYLRPKGIDMGFSDENMRLIVNNTLQQQRLIGLGKVDTKGLEADVASAMSLIKTGNVSIMGDILKNYSKAPDSILMKKKDCKTCPACPPPTDMSQYTLTADCDKKVKGLEAEQIQLMKEQDDAIAIINENCKQKLEDCKLFNPLCPPSINDAGLQELAGMFFRKLIGMK